MLFRIGLASLAIVLSTTQCFAQEHAHTPVPHDEQHKPFRVALASLNSYVPALNTRRHFVIPAWAIEAEYRFARR